MAFNYVHFRVPLPGIAIIFILPLVAFGANFATGEKAFQQRDYAKALKQFKPLAGKNDARAQRYMGVMYRSGYGVARNLEVAIQWFKRSAGNGEGDQFAQAALGSIYLDMKRYEESAAYYHQAAKQGHSDALLQLGYSYALGQGVDKSDSEAVKWFAASCEKGSKTVSLLAGKELSKSLKVPKHVEAAAMCLKRGDELGELEATALLGILYLKGSGVRQDRRQSLRLLQRAANGDEADAFYGLGLLYESDSPSNQPEAVKWFQKADAKGHPEAQLALGKLLEKGEGVPANFSKALGAYERAAKQGMVEAQYILGRHYIDGAITPKSNVDGYMWLNLAAASGYPGADALRKRTAEMMTAFQIDEAQQKGSGWASASLQLPANNASLRIHNIFDQIEGNEGTATRQQVMALITNSRRFRVVPDRQLADATITGRAESREAETEVTTKGTRALAGVSILGTRARSTSESTTRSRALLSNSVVLRLSLSSGETVWAWDDTRACSQEKAKCAVNDLVARMPGN